MCKEETTLKKRTARSLLSIGRSLGIALAFVLGARLILSFIGAVGVTSTIEKDMRELESKIQSKYETRSFQASKDQTDWVLRFYSAATFLIPKRNFANDVLPFPSDLKENEGEKIESLIEENRASLELLDRASRRSWCLSLADVAPGENNDRSSWYGFVSSHAYGATRYLLNLMNLRTIIACRKGDTALATSSLISALRFSEFPSSQQMLLGETGVRWNIFRTTVHFNKLLMDEVHFKDHELEQIFKVYESRNPISTLGRSLVNESKFGVSYVKDIVSGKKHNRNSKDKFWYEEDNLLFRSMAWFIKPLIAIDIRSYLNNQTEMVDIVCNAKNARELQKSLTTLKIKTPSYYSLYSIGFPELKENVFDSISNKARCDFSMIRIAAARTKIRTGKFPEGFKDIPEDLLALDNRMDPYTGENYRWTGKGAKFTLASFGRKGFDAEPVHQLASKYW
jgi:hypothetical protein